MHEALFYKTLKNDKVQCRLCPRNCTLDSGKTGICGVRQNIDGRLIALSYGMIASAAIDPVEKKPLYHFYPGSRTFSLGGIGCNLRCRHCQNSSLSRASMENSFRALEKLSPEEIVAASLNKNCKLLVWTYNEPSIWFEYIMDTAILARKKGLKTVLVTAGAINREPLEMLLPLIDAYRLDIKGFTEKLYRDLCGFPFLQTVLESARAAKKAGCHLEIVTNIIPNWNDDEAQMRSLAEWIRDNPGPETPWHVTAYYPALEMEEPPTPPSTIHRIAALGRKTGLKQVFAGNVRDGKDSSTLCPSCGVTLIRRSGFSLLEKKITDGACPECGYRLQMYRD